MLVEGAVRAGLPRHFVARNDKGCRVAGDSCGVGRFGLDCRVACAPRNDKIVKVWGWVAFTPMRLINCLPMVMVFNVHFFFSSW